MSQQFSNAATQQFATNIELLLQQKGSRLRDTVTVGTGYRGKQASPVEQVGIIEAQANTSRYAPIEPRDTPHDRPWLFPETYDWADFVDHIDKLKAITDPTSAYVMSAVNALGRRLDSIIIAQLFADRKTGELATTTTSFLANHVVGVTVGAGGNTGLNLAKLRAAKAILMADEVDFDSEQVTCVITSQESDDLLNETQMVSLDYNEKPVLVEGRITRFMGFNFKHSERLQLDGSGYRRIPVYAKSKVHAGIWEDIVTSVEKRIDLRGHPYQVYAQMTTGATRVEEKGVVEIKSYHA